MKHYFYLQVIMTNRKMRDAGLNPVLGYFLALIVLVFLPEFIYKKEEWGKYLLILICLGLQFQLLEKNRNEFLLSTFGVNQKIKIRILENLVFCLPFVLFLASKNQFLEAIILFLCSIGLAFASFQADFTLTIPTPFSKRPFEFSTGFRKTFFLFLIAYALTVIAIHVDNLNLGLFALFMVFLTSLTYYLKPEPPYYVWIHAESPRRFLVNKLRRASINAAFLAAPIFISLWIVYPADLKLILGSFLVGLLFLVTVILAKYAAYPAEMNLISALLLFMNLYFPPLFLAIIPFFYIQSIQKLTLLLNDRHQKSQ
jgi:hypothetical protein